MASKEISSIKRKDIPYDVRQRIVAKVRSFTEAAKPADKSIHSVEAFNNRYLHKNPDRVGITLFYPNKENPTHMKIGIFDISIGEKEFTKQVKLLETELLQKAGVL